MILLDQLKWYWTTSCYHRLSGSWVSGPQQPHQPIISLQENQFVAILPTCQQRKKCDTWYNFYHVIYSYHVTCYLMLFVYLFHNISTNAGYAEKQHKHLPGGSSANPSPNNNPTTSTMKGGFVFPKKKKPPAPPKKNIWICRLQGDFCVEIPSVLLIFRVTVTKLTDLNPWSIENRPLLVLHWRRHNLAPDKHVSMKDSSNRPLRTGKQKEQLFEDILFYSSFKRESLIVNIWLNHPITYSNYSGPKGYDSDMTIPDRYCISSTWSTGVDKRQL